MTTKQYPELLLCRFTHEQRAFIRREAKKNKLSDAGVIRGLVMFYMTVKSSNELNDSIKKYSQRIKV